MIFYVTDANIFIDLHYAGLLNLMPQLGLPIVTTLLVADELNSEQLIELQSLINIKTLEIREVTIGKQRFRLYCIWNWMTEDDQTKRPAKGGGVFNLKH